MKYLFCHNEFQFWWYFCTMAISMSLYLRWTSRYGITFIEYILWQENDDKLVNIKINQMLIIVQNGSW